MSVPLRNHPRLFRGRVSKTECCSEKQFSPKLGLSLIHIWDDGGSAAEQVGTDQLGALVKGPGEHAVHLELLPVGDGGNDEPL